VDAGTVSGTAGIGAGRTSLVLRTLGSVQSWSLNPALAAVGIESTVPFNFQQPQDSTTNEDRLTTKSVRITPIELPDGSLEEPSENKSIVMPDPTLYPAEKYVDMSYIAEARRTLQ
jgi:hypothetical protein